MRFHALQLAIFVSLFAHVPALAQTPSTAPQRINLVVGTPPGGGYDSYARLVARHLPAQLAGSPTINVQNMPGAGSLIAANWLANSAPKDGSAIAVVPNGTIFEALLGNASAHFDARKLNLLGSLNDFTSIGAVWHTSPFVTTQDFLTKEVLIGASAANSNNSITPNLLNTFVHTKFKIVNGYPGSTGIELAMERGEVQGEVGPDWDFLKATRANWIRDKKIRILLQATLKRHHDLADVPTVMELVDADNRDVLALLIGRQTYGGVFMAPPDAPPALIASLREAFTKMTANADFRNDAAKSSLTLNPASAEEVTATIGKLLASPRTVIDRATAELRRLDPQ
jgi:tripartite-type tricarboxylate transporter receptor subunit TctC